MATLEDLDTVLNDTTIELLGDTITYTPSGGGPLSFKALVDYADEAERLGGSRKVTADVSIEVPRARVAEPDGQDVITLPKTGLEYLPKDWLLDRSGDNWIIALKKKPI